MTDQPTIFALSSGHGRAGVAVIRISGPAAGKVLERMVGGRPEPRVAMLRAVRDPQTREVLDGGLVLWFPAPKSETGEDMVELQVHGGRAVIAGVLAAIGKINGCRLAEPGEFARRAFENGKLDLTGVEGLADLIEAETAAQRRQALRQAGGALARLYGGWRRQLIEAMALLEAAIDFSDEGDVARDAEAMGRAQVLRLSDEIARHLDDGHRGEVLREGFQVVLAGPPNAGKSSLLNALARREVAIVSDEAGTTRDVIEVKLDLEGLPIVVSDTAGIREAAGRIEQEGVRRALERAERADLVVWLVDASEAVPARLPEVGPSAGDRLVVISKADLAGAGLQVPPGAIAVSAMTGQGLDELTRRLAEAARGRLGDQGEGVALTQARHRQQLELCLAALRAALEQPAGATELGAEDLRRAADALGRLTGVVGVEEVLGQVFGRFCIGK
jgi:tRNA modification GTPase